MARKKLPVKLGLPVTLLLRNTPNKIFARAGRRNISVVRLKTGLTDKGRPQSIFKTQSRFPTTARIPPIHKTIIRFMGPKRRFWVSCTCEHFWYNCEYALWKHKASSIIHSNGEPPVITNPRYIPFLCKHLVRVLLVEGNISRLEQLWKKSRTGK